MINTFHSVTVRSIAGATTRWLTSPQKTKWTSPLLARPSVPKRLEFVRLAIRSANPASRGSVVKERADGRLAGKAPSSAKLIPMTIIIVINAEIACGGAKGATPKMTNVAPAVTRTRSAVSKAVSMCALEVQGTGRRASGAARTVTAG